MTFRQLASANLEKGRSHASQYEVTIVFVFGPCVYKETTLFSREFFEPLCPQYPRVDLRNNFRIRKTNIQVKFYDGSELMS